MKSGLDEPSRTSGGGQILAAIAGFVGLELLFIVLFRFGDLELHVIGTIAVGLAAGIIYLLTLYAFEHLPERPATLWIILAGALLFRLTLLPLVPTLSDDAQRYRWDGQVQLAGYNPYTVKPDQLPFGSRITPLGHSLPGHDIVAIYPPLAELAFREAARYLPGSVEFKLPMVFADLASILLLAALLRSRDHRIFRLAIYAWNPLVVVEFAGSGHSDALAIAALLAALLIIRWRAEVSTILLGAASLLKLFPVMLFPLWLRRTGGPRSWATWIGATGALVLAAVCAWPYLSALATLPANLFEFAARYQDNNASLFALLKGFSGSANWARGLGVGVVVGIALWAAARRLEPERAAFLIFGAILLLSPNAYSWYFTWIIPFLCFFPSPAWLLLTVLQFLSYHTLVAYGITGEWHWSPFMICLTYVPFYAVLLWKTANRKRNSIAAIP